MLLDGTHARVRVCLWSPEEEVENLTVRGCGNDDISGREARADNEEGVFVGRVRWICERSQGEEERWGRYDVGEYPRGKNKVPAMYSVGISSLAIPLHPGNINDEA
jgi:hypothetical protein